MSKIFLVIYPVLQRFSSTQIEPQRSVQPVSSTKIASQHARGYGTNPKLNSNTQPFCTLKAVNASHLITPSKSHIDTQAPSQDVEKSSHQKTEHKEQQKAQKRSQLLFIKNNNPSHGNSKNNHAVHQPKSRNRFKHT